MPIFDCDLISWRAPWQPISPSGAQQAVDELRREICAGHLLFDRDAQAIGRRQDCDDLLYYLGETIPQFAVVHLTYRKETQPEWPFTTLFGTLEEWIRDCMIPDALEFGSGE